MALWENGKKCQTVCKPGSVPTSQRRWMAIHLGRPLPNASRNRPGRRLENPPAGQNRHAVPIWFCSRWGLPCRRRLRWRGALLPHPFTLTRRHEDRPGGLLSVALSLGSPPPGVTRHRVFMEPGLSSPAASTKAAIRPSGKRSLAPIFARSNTRSRLAASQGMQPGDETRGLRIHAAVRACRPEMALKRPDGRAQIANVVADLGEKRSRAA